MQRTDGLAKRLSEANATHTEGLEPPLCLSGVWKHARYVNLRVFTAHWPGACLATGLDEAAFLRDQRLQEKGSCPSLTRHELKEQLQHDQFSDSVSHALSYASSHKQRLIQWGVIAGVVAVIVIAAVWFNIYRRSLRQQDLQKVFTILDAQVGPPNEYVKTFATADEKTQASINALSEVVAKDRGTREGYLAQYYLGTLKAQKGDIKGAESDLRTVTNSSSDSSALAKIALAQLYVSAKRTAEAQDLLRSLVNKPTDLVSKAQAEVLLAQLDETANPKESKRILQGLKTPNESPAVSRAADQISSQLAK